MPDFESAARFREALLKAGCNLASDGRPIIGLDSRDLLEITLEASEHGYLVPAHIWTPWFSALGSKSGFDAIAHCYADLAGHITAVETGLSSDPEMNQRVSSLDAYRLVSNSDAHSPQALAREATQLRCEVDYFAVKHALSGGDGLVGTIEFFPEEGKYHADGHRDCGVNWSPAQTKAANGICPVCGRQLTVGVLARVEELADRPLPTVREQTVTPSFSCTRCWARWRAWERRAKRWRARFPRSWPRSGRSSRSSHPCHWTRSAPWAAPISPRASRACVMAG